MPQVRLVILAAIGLIVLSAAALLSGLLDSVPHPEIASARVAPVAGTPAPSPTAAAVPAPGASVTPAPIITAPVDGAAGSSEPQAEQHGHHGHPDRGD